MSTQFISFEDVYIVEIGESWRASNICRGPKYFKAKYVDNMTTYIKKMVNDGYSTDDELDDDYKTFGIDPYEDYSQITYYVTLTIDDKTMIYITTKKPKYLKLSEMLDNVNKSNSDSE